MWAIYKILLYEYKGFIHTTHFNTAPFNTQDDAVFFHSGTLVSLPGLLMVFTIGRSRISYEAYTNYIRDTVQDRFTGFPTVVISSRRRSVCV